MENTFEWIKENGGVDEETVKSLIEIQQIQQNGKADSNRRTVAYQKALNVHLSEAQTRELIDEQLRKVGWEVDTKELRYSKGTRQAIKSSKEIQRKIRLISTSTNEGTEY